MRIFVSRLSYCPYLISSYEGVSAGPCETCDIVLFGIVGVESLYEKRLLFASR